MWRRRVLYWLGSVAALVGIASVCFGAYLALTRPRHPIPSIGATHYLKEALAVVYLNGTEKFIYDALPWLGMAFCGLAVVWQFYLADIKDEQERSGEN